MVIITHLLKYELQLKEAPEPPEILAPTVYKNVLTE